MKDQQNITSPSESLDVEISFSQPIKQEDSQDIQQQKLNEIEQSVSKQKSKKSKIINIVFFIVNIVVVAGILIYQLMGEDFQVDESVKLSLNLSSLVVVALLLFAVVICDTFAISYLLKQSTGKWRWGISYKTSQIGRYYDSVTPMSTGGQPFQVTYLKGRGVPIHNALSIPLAKYMFNQIGWLLVSLMALIVSWVDNSYGTFVSIASIVGFVLASFVLFVMFFLSISKKVGRVLVVKTLKLLYKMKIVKNYDKQYEKITKAISDYQDVMKQFAKSPKDFIIMSSASFLKCFVNYSIPFFIIQLFVPAIAGEYYFKLLVMTTLVDLSSSFFPMPGGTGMNEISFSAAFAAVVGKQAPIVWVLLVWRLCSYYFYLVQGIFIITYDVVYGNRKYRWQVVKNNLMEESAVFKQQQINRFRADRARRRKTKSKV